MNKRHLILPLFALVGAAFVSGCQKTDATAPTAAPTASVTPADEPPVVPAATPSRAVSAASPTPLRDALTSLFEREENTSGSAFPKGTRLLNVDIKDKAALVDVSKEFDKLQNMGESNEGKVQKQMCAALAKFPNVDTLHLTVEGKDYESQAADWRSIPVRPGADAGEMGSLRTAEGGR